jgi:hypothetical protein
MAAEVLFLSEQTLKDRSVLQDNVDMKVVKPTITDVQKYYVLPIMGTQLYNEVINQIRTGTLTVLNTTLLNDYITDVMVWYCRMELPMAMNYKYFNKAVGVQNADNMQPASMQDIERIMDDARNKAQVYAQRMTNYLLANSVQYPLYLNQVNTNVDTIFAKQNNYNSGLVLGDGNGCGGQYNFQGIKIQPSEKRCHWC